MSEPAKKEYWHFGKEIPITLVFLIMIQTASGLWWAATLTNKLDNLSTQMIDLRAERYSKTEALKDISLINLKIENLENRINEINVKKR